MPIRLDQRKLSECGEIEVGRGCRRVQSQTSRSRDATRWSLAADPAHQAFELKVSTALASFCSALDNCLVDIFMHISALVMQHDLWENPATACDCCRVLQPRGLMRWIFGKERRGLMRRDSRVVHFIWLDGKRLRSNGNL